MNRPIHNTRIAQADPPPYGDGLFANEPPSGNGLNITDLFHIVEPKPDDPDINSVVDSQYPNVAIITHDATNQFGGMWAKEKLDLTVPFSTEMYLHLGHQYNKTGSVADGMTFTLHNDPAGLNAIGGAGEGLGAYRGRKWTGTDHYTTTHGTYLRNSLVIEFDTYRNRISEGGYMDDPGNAGTSHSALIIPRADVIYIWDHLNTYYFTPTQQWVKFDAAWTPNGSGGGTLTYSFDGQERTYTVANILSTFGDTKVYWGFTGSTGELTSVQAAAITRLPSQGIIAEKTVENAAGKNIDRGNAHPGEILTYTIRVTAASLITTIGPIIIEDQISEYVEYVAGNVRVTTKAGNVYEVAPAFAGSTMRVNTDHIFTEVDDWLEISYLVQVRENAAGAVIVNTATVTAQGLAEPQDSNTTEVTVITPPVKKVSDTSEAGKDGGAVKVGDQITYGITYTNYEAAAATVVIVDQLSTGVDFVSATNGGIYSSAAHTVTWTLASVPGGASGTVSLVVRVNQSAVLRIEDYATVQVGENEPLITNSVENPVITMPEKEVSGTSEAGRDGAAVQAGDLITYNISYVNYQTSAATVIITDRLPTGVDFVSARNGGVYDSATHTVTWTMASMPGGAGGMVFVVVRVNQSAEIAIEDSATVQVGENEPLSTNTVENPVITFPEKEIAETSEAGRDDGTVRIGDQITYDIHYTNYEPSAATVIIADRLPTGVDFVSATYGGIYDNAAHTVTWTLASVPGGAGGTISLVVRVNQNAEVSIENYVTVQVGENEPLISNTVENPVFPEKNVSETSEAGKGGEAVKVGDEITYDIAYANYEATAATVVITDRLPMGVDYMSATGGGVYDSATHTIVWTLAGVPGGAIGTVSVAVRVNQYALTGIENYATVQVGDNEPRITNTVENPVLPEKHVSEAGEAGKDGGAVKVGDEITYDIIYANYEPTTATIVIIDQLPTGVDYVSSTGGGIYDNTTHTVTWTLAGVPGDTIGTVSLVVRVNGHAVVSIGNHASVQVGDNEPRITNTAENPVIIPPEKMVSETSEAGRDGGGVMAGDTITYAVTYANYGEIAATVVITDHLPTGVDFVSATNGGILNSVTHTVTWTLADIPGGTGGTVSLVVRVNQNAVIRIENTATVRVGENEPLVTNRVENPVIIPPAKTVSEASEAGRGGGAVKVGDLITYDISYANHQETTAAIVITDRLPTGVDFVSATNGGIYDIVTHIVTWTLANVPGGAGGIVSVLVRVNQYAEVRIENYATVQVDGNEPLVTNTSENPVIAPPEKMVSDTSEAGRDKSAVKVGDRITYAITYTNYEVAAATIVIIDQLSTGVDFVSASNGGIYNSAAHTVTWTLADVPGGAGGTVSLVVRVNQYAEVIIENYATVQVGENEPQVTPILGNPVIAPPEKRVSDTSEAGRDGGAVKVGDQITYDITYENYEAIGATVVIIDRLSIGADFVSATDGGIYDSAAHTVTWTLTDVPGDYSSMVSLVVRVNQYAEVRIENYATVQVGNNEPFTTNIVDNPVITPPEKLVSDTSEAGIDGGKVKVGDQITYDITYVNYQSTAATVTIVDRLPMGVDFVSATNGGIFSNATHTVTWTLADVPGGAGGIVSLVVRVNRNAVVRIENYATVQVGNNEPQITNRVDNDVIAPPEKLVSDTSEAGQNGATVKVGDQITYDITYMNYEATAATIVINDRLPSGVDFVSATNGGILSSATHTVTWTLAGVPGGTSGTVSLVVRVNQNAGVRVENYATVQVGNNAPQITNSVGNAVITHPEKMVSDSSEAGQNGATVKVGDQITYDITYMNYEPTPATIIITDRLPAGVDFVSATNGGILSSATHTVTWTLAGVPGGTSGTVSLVVRVNQNAGVRVENYATVQVGINEPLATNTVENPVVRVPVCPPCECPPMPCECPPMPCECPPKPCVCPPIPCVSPPKTCTSWAGTCTSRPCTSRVSICTPIPNACPQKPIASRPNACPPKQRTCPPRHNSWPL